jgi:membrane-bound lytic murein transglycosylase B
VGKGKLDGLRNLNLVTPVVISFLIIALLMSPDSPAGAAIEATYLEKQAELVQSLTARGFSEEDLSGIFSDRRVMIYPEIVGRSGKGINYLGRHFGLLSKKSILEGKQIVRDNRSLLRHIESAYGVEKEVLVAILRLETNFGRVKGNVPIFNSLLTLSLIENRRSAWAEEELAYLLWMCRNTQKDPLEVRGSWAGAFGLPQFVPSSYVKYGVDGNGDGSVDLNNQTDALASIANYLKSFGWSRKNLADKKQALYAYNHCDHYVQAVLTYARAIMSGPLGLKNRKTRSVSRRSPKE